MGVPCYVEKINGVTGVFDDEGNEVPGFLAVPGLDKKSPTLVGLLGIVLMNLQRVVGSSIGYRTDEPTEEEQGSTVTITARSTKILAKNGGSISFVVTRKPKSPTADDELIYVNLMFNSTLGKEAFSGDFKPGLWSLDFKPGQRSARFSITVEKNESLKEDHSVTVVLSGGEGYELGNPKTATVLIVPSEDKEDKETELTENDWLLKFDLPEPKPDFVPDLTEEI
jgi:hypothetical protein